MSSSKEETGMMGKIQDGAFDRADKIVVSNQYNIILHSSEEEQSIYINAVPFLQAEMTPRALKKQTF